MATIPEAEEAVVELLQTLFGVAASSYTDVDSGHVTVSVFSRRNPARLREPTRAGLRRIGRCGLNIGPGRCWSSRLKTQDWAESWKRHFRPIEIGSALLVKPSWSKRRMRAGQRVVVLDPGLSFGTGHHPTTAFCLEQVAAHRRAKATQSFLDIGTGSGILAIAAAKLGYARVEAFDCDPESVRVARANAQKNRVTGRILVSRKDLKRLPSTVKRRYDVICANLTADLLTAESGRIVSRLKPGGVLVLAGILAVEFPRTRRVYKRVGLRWISGHTEGDWQSGVFRMPL